MNKFKGRVIASKIIKLKFSQSGVVGLIKVAVGQKVSKGQTLATLDNKLEQINLEVELADYRRMRAEFDRLTRTVGAVENDDEKTKKEIAQAKLDVSVKEVEKRELIKRQTDLVSPINGIVLDTNGLTAGMNITPSGFPIEIADIDSLVFEIQVPETEVYRLRRGQKATIKLINGEKIKGEIILIGPKGKGKDEIVFPVRFKLPASILGKIGTTGEVEI